MFIYCDSAAHGFKAQVDFPRNLHYIIQVCLEANKLKGRQKSEKKDAKGPGILFLFVWHVFLNV